MTGGRRDLLAGRSERFAAAVEAIDAANRDDPSLVSTASGPRPKELVHAELMTEWVARLDADADELQLLAARAHHLRRWEVPRSSYAVGRAGYLRWRTDQKARHAALVGELLSAVGYRPDEIARVQAIIRKEGLRNDAAVQTHEDALCLVFLGEQLADFAHEHGEERTIEIVRKTAQKMSVRGRAAVGDLDLAPDAARLVERALST